MESTQVYKEHDLVNLSPFCIHEKFQNKEPTGIGDVAQLRQCLPGVDEVLDSVSVAHETGMACVSPNPALRR